MTIFRIYALTDPDGSPRYVGQTALPLAQRLNQHMKPRGSSGRARWLRSLLDEGLAFGCVELAVIEGKRRDAYVAETSWIKRLRAEGHQLVNVP